MHDQNRVLAFHRWVEGEGQDVMVILHLANFTRVGYQIGLPGEGAWREVFNSDVYENGSMPAWRAITAASWPTRKPLHGFGYSAGLVLPANSILISPASHLVFPCVIVSCIPATVMPAHSFSRP